MPEELARRIARVAIASLILASSLVAVGTRTNGRRDEPGPAELRSDRARAVSDGRGRLCELSHCARLRPAFRRRAVDRELRSASW